MEEWIDEKKLASAFKEALNNRGAMSILGLGLNICASDENFIWKVKEIKKVLNDNRFRRAYRKLCLKHFPIQWKVFYFLSKYNCAIGVYLMLCIIKKLITRK